jgi:hypothetical protein
MVKPPSPTEPEAMRVLPSMPTPDLHSTIHDRDGRTADPGRLRSGRYRTDVPSAGVARCAGVSRSGAIGGPVAGGLLVAVGPGLNSISSMPAAIAVFGALLVPSAASRTAKFAAAAPALDARPR